MSTNVVNPYALTVDDIGKQFRFHDRPFTLMGFQITQSHGELTCSLKLAPGSLTGDYAWYQVHSETDWLYRV